CHSSGTDTLFIYKTTDHGYTWDVVYSMNPGSGGQLLDFDMKLEPFVTDNPNIYLIWADSVPASGYRLFFGAIQPGVTSIWYEFTDSDYDSTFQVAMDVEPDSNPFIVISCISLYYTAGETQWYTASSADGGAVWDVYGPHTSSMGPMEVTAACNDSDVFYVGSIYTQSSNRFRTWGNQSGFVNVSSANDTVRYTPNIVTQKYHAYPSNYVYGLYTQGTDPRVYYNYSTDGGANWQTPAIWSMSGDVYSNNPNMRLGWDMTVDRPAACCYIEGGSFDSLVAALMTSDYYSWDGRIIPNDYNLTTTMPAQINASMVHNGRFLIYREYNVNNIWFDRWDHYNQVEETPNILPDANFFSVFQSSGIIQIRFSTPTNQQIKIEVYDILGRNINTLAERNFSAGEHNLEWNMTGNNGEKVVAGTYFINFTTETRKETKSVQVF
ncbi:T9SS type A sorting domain-containing protein, partial [candidate division WOR-3 bacterium]|nr:T9SS type A sorting domain-containing protein [candidate division WOR-3 bacterium]